MEECGWLCLELSEIEVLVHSVFAKYCCAMNFAMYRAQRGLLSYRGSVQ